MIVRSPIVLALFSLMTVTGISVAQAQIQIRDLQRQPGTSIAGEIRSVVGNQFILADGTGQIIVDAGPRWYQQLDLSAGERVTVNGEYDDNAEEFEAYSITRNNGVVIQIRPPGGLPPWAGGPNRRER